MLPYHPYNSVGETILLLLHKVCTCLATILPTCLLAYLPTCLPACLPAFLSQYISFYQACEDK